MNKYQWNLKPISKKDRAEVEKVNSAFVKKWQGRQDYLVSPKVLKQALDDYEALYKSYGTSGAEGYYYGLRLSQEQDNPTLKATNSKIEEFEKRMGNNLQFFELNLSKVPPQIQKKLLSAPDLKDYKHFLAKNFAWGKYLLSEKEEKILNLKVTSSHSNWVRMTSSFLDKEEREGKSFNEIVALTSDKNKKIRDKAAKQFNEIMDRYKEVATEELNSILGNKKVDDELRGMDRPDLGRHLSDDIDTKMVDTLLYVVEGNFDQSQRYYKLKAKLFGIKKLQYHERNVEYGQVEKKYTWQQACDLVKKVFRELDPEFLEIFEGFLKQGQFDLYPRKGKKGGAFCAGGLISYPTYILLNFTDRLRDIETLAHESGHGINNELMRKKQNSLNFSTPLSTAEVASTFMEDFVLQEILRGANDEERLSLLMTKLNSDISTIHRQTACYLFEKELHAQFRAKGYLSTEEIGKIFQRYMNSYMGPAVEQSPGSENWWVYWSHIRRFFYVYSYVSGLLISKGLQAGVKKDPAFIKKVKEFLSAGGSDSPKNIFKKLGIDITDKAFWQSGLKEVEDLLKETEKLARKLGKI